MVKECARCHQQFEESEKAGFITCPTCRRPLPKIAGGCTQWFADNAIVVSPDGRIEIRKKMEKR